MRLLVILFLTVAISVAVPVSDPHAYGGGGGGSGGGTQGDKQESTIESRVSFLDTASFELRVILGLGIDVVGHQDSVGAGVNPPGAPVSGNENLDRDVLEFALYLAAIEAGAYPTGDVIVSNEAIDKLDELFGDKGKDVTPPDAVQSGSPPANTRSEYPGVSFRVEQINEDTKKFSGTTKNDRIIVTERRLPNGTILTEREHQPKNPFLWVQTEHINQWTDVSDPGIENLTYLQGSKFVHIMKWENGQTLTAERFHDRCEYTYGYPERYPGQFNNKPVINVVEIKELNSYDYNQTITYADGTKETRESNKPFGCQPISLEAQMEMMRRK
jgi:hypothetical protein